MEMGSLKQGTVDPEVRAYVYSLVTALGGSGGDEYGAYVLGDDALACLRDLKRWLKLYDEKTNRYDVARCLAEANLVNGDLLPILASWPDDGKDHRLRARLALACLELLVPLTWPMESNEAMTINHHRHMPYILQAQVAYKRGILNSEDANYLRTVVRIALPSMALPRSERTNRDEGIIKLVLYFLRNVAVITPSQYLPLEGDENEVSRSATIDAFHRQDVFALLLTMASNMGEDFNQQDVALLEILFHLIKGVDVRKLFLDDDERKTARKGELKAILQKESGMNRDYAKTASTRHGRFGTMIWVKRADEKVSTVSGQDVLMNGRRALQKMDETKKWNKPSQRSKNDNISFENFDQAVHLTATATKHLRVFVEEFLDSGFNPLFTHLRKAIEREAERVHDGDYKQFFFLISWFLEAERLRRERQAKVHKRKTPEQELEVDSYALVASVLNQETFITLNRYMQISFDNREWQDLNASMRCFTQILLTVQEMAQSSLEDDQEIAENIQNRIFYEETTHDRILAILRGYKDQGFGYLDACTELSHVFLRMLERYSKENVDLQIRTRRRARKRKAAEKPTPADNNGNDDDDASEAEELADAARVSTERKFDFTRFAAKFATQKCVDTFTLFTSYFKDLDLDQLKRAHRYFYRVAFKQESTIVLFRIDIIALLYKMIKGPGGLDSSQPIFREWEELVRQLLKRMVRKLQERPLLVVELLFSKIPSTLYFLEYGEEKQTVSLMRAPAELEINPNGTSTNEQKIAIVVSALLDDDKLPLAQWIAKVLKSAADERISWEHEQEARAAAEIVGVNAGAPNPEPVNHGSTVVRPDSDLTKAAMFKNAKLRLLMTLVGFERLGTDDFLGSTWTIPSTLTGSELDASHKAVQRALQNPLSEVNGNAPGAQLRRKKTDEEDAVHGGFIDDSEGASDIDEEFLFPDNVRSKTMKSDALEALKKKRGRKAQDEDKEGRTLNDKELEARRKARKAAALERRRKIKSELKIRDSDDESDPEADREFFAMEEERRKRNESQIMEALRKVTTKDDSKTEKSTRRKRKSEGGEASIEKRKRRSNDDEGGDDQSSTNENANESDSDDEGLFIRDSPSSHWKSAASEQFEDDMSNDDTPLSSQSRPSNGEAADKVDLFEADMFLSDSPSAHLEMKDAGIADAMHEEETNIVSAPPRAQRTRGLFIIDSDSE